MQHGLIEQLNRHKKQHLFPWLTAQPLSPCLSLTCITKPPSAHSHLLFLGSVSKNVRVYRWSKTVLNKRHLSTFSPSMFWPPYFKHISSHRTLFQMFTVKDDKSNVYDVRYLRHSKRTDRIFKQNESTFVSITSVSYSKATPNIAGNIQDKLFSRSAREHFLR